MNNYSHIGQPLAVRNVVIPMAYEGVLFNFDNGVFGTGAGKIHYPEDGYVATLRPNEGRFGSAVAVEEETTNHITNTDFELWTLYTTSDATGEISYRDDPVMGKVVRLKKTDSGSGRFGLRRSIQGMSGSVYTQSIYVRALSSSGRIACMYVDAIKTGGGLLVSGPLRNLSDFPLGQWVRTQSTRDGGSETLSGGGTTYIWIEGDKGECEFAMPQIELKPFATSFTADSRDPGLLEYPTSLFNPSQGTISVMVYKNYFSNYNARILWTNQGGNRFGIHDTPGGGITWAYVTSGSGQASVSEGLLPLRTWTRITMTWNRDEGWMKGYVNDEEMVHLDFSPGTNPGFVYSDKWRLGVHMTGGYFFNGLYDELLILDRAATHEEIRMWHRANSPMIDPFTNVLIAY